MKNLFLISVLFVLSIGVANASVQSIVTPMSITSTFGDNTVVMTASGTWLNNMPYSTGTVVYVTTTTPVVEPPVVSSGTSVNTRIFYSDLASGCTGSYIQIFGIGFGSTRNNSSVSVCGTTVSNYVSWTDTQIAFQVPAQISGNGIYVTVNNTISNSIAFSTRTCNIYYVSTNGNDSTGNGTILLPWKTWSKARNSMKGGSICYIRGGTYPASNESYSGKFFYVSGSYSFASNASTGSPTCMVGFPGETVLCTGGSIVSYAGSSVSGAYATSNIVFANFVIDGQGSSLNGITWRGCGNGPKNPRVSNIRVVNVEIKNGYNTSSGGGMGVVEFGGDGPVDNVKVYGCKIHNIDSSSKLDHAIYISAGGKNVDIGWNTIYSHKKVNASGLDGYAGFGIQLYRGSESTSADCLNPVIHDNYIYDCTDRGGINIADHTTGDINIYNNIISSCGTAGRGYGCGIKVIDNNSASTLGTLYIYNNTFYGNGTIGSTDGSSNIFLNASSFVRAYIRNNIFYNKANQPYATNAGSSTWYKNDFYGNGTAPTFDTGSLNVNPLFSNVALSDYHLQSTSPMQGVGYNTTTIVTTDKDGKMRTNPPALGCYEK